MANLVELIKKAADEANEASKPMGVYFGTVTKDEPLEINVEQKINLTKEFLILTNAVKDHYVDITVSHNTEKTTIDHTHDVQGSTGSADSPPHTHKVDITSQTNEPTTTHLHAYKGKKKMLIHNGLKIGEKVMLLRVQGGQKYVVVDRISDHIVEGQWL